MYLGEQIIEVDDVGICVESMGDPADPAIVLLHGAGESMLTWDDAFVGRLVAGDRRVIRYDSRDAGRSTVYPVGAPAYGLRDLVSDLAALIEALGLGRVHLVGMSQGAAVAQLAALEHPDLVASLSLASGTPGGPGHEQVDLPGMSPGLEAYFGDEPVAPDWSDRDAVVEYLIAVTRPFAAATRPFDIRAQRRRARRVVDRAIDIAAQLSNPFLIDAGDPWRERLRQIRIPTLVLHGTEDPFLPIEHGRALAAEIADARLVPLEGTGHEVFPLHTWDVVVPEVLAHTSVRRVAGQRPVT
ncbi:alpha/beta fold hydrolase [Nocardia rhamnosiphila]|uniref:alpha/beta fold hydrolase n=2 Tax=Nocardiaceae TaxID=85025 RepID=UPI0005696084|nr:alpha/beta hydrolase [Nocardia rhamnosiphila]